LATPHRKGAKSWNEPANEPQTTDENHCDPCEGWTHTSNWVALELTERANVTIRIDRQPGVPPSPGSTKASSTDSPTGDLANSFARDRLFPALSLFSGWDSTTASKLHQYNNEGNFTWGPNTEPMITYIDNEPNTAHQASITFTKTLDAGKYSIAIGGNPPALPSLAAYPANTCSLTEGSPAAQLRCWTYTGRHGYRATMITTPAP
jgi:hypothetical protein